MKINRSALGKKNVFLRCFDSLSLLDWIVSCIVSIVKTASTSFASLHAVSFSAIALYIAAISKLLLPLTFWVC